MTEIEKVTNNQAKARSIYNSLIKDNIFYTGISKNLAIALIELGVDSSNTDKLSFEKLQEQNKTMKLALVELSDENIYDNTGFFANEYAKNLVEQIDAGEIETIVERCIRNHQEQLNTAKKALTEIAEILNDKIHKCDYSCDNFCEFDGSLNMYSVENVQSVIDSSLAAIGGDK